jgi:hypothetical protein
VGIDR